MDFFFFDNFNKTKEYLGINLSVDHLHSVWKEIEDINSNKAIAYDVNSPIAQLARLTISQYLCLSYSISSTRSYNREHIAISSILENVINTAFAIYKLTIDGLEYPAVSLIRTLYEQILLLLNAVISTRTYKTMLSR